MKEEAKKKAEELANKFVTISVFDMDNNQLKYERIKAKQCAIIAVDEILDIDCKDMSEENFDNHIEFWQQVKEEINRL